MPTDHSSGHKRRPIFLRKGFYIPLVLLTLLAFFPLSSLEVRDIDDNGVLFLTTASQGKTFEIHYIHSVERIPVAGIFGVSDRNQIEVRETISSSYGAGLPSDASLEDVTFEGDRMRIRHHGIVMDRLRIFISPFTNQHFIYAGRVVDLSLAKEGHIVEIRVRSIPLFLYCFRTLTISSKRALPNRL